MQVTQYFNADVSILTLQLTCTPNCVALAKNWRARSRGAGRPRANCCWGQSCVHGCEHLRTAHPFDPVFHNILLLSDKQVQESYEEEITRGFGYV